MCSIDLEPAEVFTDKWVKKARKEHKCDSCFRKIKRGEAYLKHFQIFEGEILHEKACCNCGVDREFFADAPGHGSMCPSQFHQMINDCTSDDLGDAVWVAMAMRLDERREAARMDQEAAGCTN